MPFDPTYSYYTFTIGTAAWIAALLFATAIAAVMAIGPKSTYVLAGVSAFFGVMPFLLLPPVLEFVGRFNFRIFNWQIYPIECLLMVLASLFPILEEVAGALARVRRQFTDLDRLAGLRFGQRLKELFLPQFARALLVGAGATLPMSILLSVIFEWARGGSNGLGAIVQGTIQSGGAGARFFLIIIVGVPTFVAYLSINYIRQILEVKTQLHEDADSQVGYEKSTERPLDRLKAKGVGLLIGAGAYVAIWWLAFSSSSLDSSIRITPVRFVLGLTGYFGSHVALYGAAIGSVMGATITTASYALFAALLGCVSAAVCATLVSRYSSARRIVGVLAAITQSVPIFVLIPLYLLVFQSRVIVGGLVAISVTFFQGYQIFESRLAAIPSIWNDLMRATNAVSQWTRLWRLVRYWYGPIVLHYGAAAVAVVAPSGVAAALVVDLFLGIGGLGWLSVYEARTELFVGILVINACLGLSLGLYVLANFASANIRRQSA